MMMNTVIMARIATTISSDALNVGEGPSAPMEHYQMQWYAAYTSANHEKRVAGQMVVRGVEHFLPLYASVRRWRNGRVTLQRPLFPGYVFVRIALREKLRVQQIPGVARLVGFDGTPAALPEEEIEALRTRLGGGLRAEPHPFMTGGRRVRVMNGPLAGMAGVLVKRKNGARFVISVELIQRAMAVEIDEADVEPVTQ